MKKLFTVIGLALFLGGCHLSDATLEQLKAASPRVWEERGFKTLAYDGYTYQTEGLCVWYTLHHIPDNGITYAGCIAKWNDEIMVYGPHAIDAIKP